MARRFTHGAGPVAIVTTAGIAGAAVAQDCDPNWQPAFVYDETLYPFANRCLGLPGGIIHYFDEGPTTDPAGTVLMLHGNPSWSFLYRDIALKLAAEGYRVIAPDMYGFGLSDKPDPATFAYSPRAHSQVLAEFVRRLDLRDVTLMVQDWGGPIGFATASHEPERYGSFVVLNTWAWRITAANRAYFHHAADWAGDNVRYSEWFIDTGTLPRNVGQSIAASHAPPGTPEYEAIRNAYWGPFLDLDTGAPLGDDVMQPTNRFYHFFSRDPAFMREVEVALAGFADRPAYFVIGGRDAWFGALRCDETREPQCPPGTQCERADGLDLCLEANTGDRVYPALDEFLARWNPDAVRGTHVSDTAGHFVQEHEVDAIVEAVRAVTAK